MTEQTEPPVGAMSDSIYGGRRAYVVEILRSAKEPLSVVDIAERVGIHANTARFHLESLVDAGLATREAEISSQPGRRRILYAATESNQARERSQGYRLLAQILVGAIAAKASDEGAGMYQVGVYWGDYLTSRPTPFEKLDESTIDRRMLDQIDPDWFEPELVPGSPSQLIFHHCPFVDAARTHPGIVCRMHGGMINGSLAELRSCQRVVELRPMSEGQECCALLGTVEQLGEAPITLALPEEPATA